MKDLFPRLKENCLHRGQRLIEIDEGGGQEFLRKNEKTKISIRYLV